jgi:hypothetical protein
LIGPPNVLGFPKPASSMRTTKTFGACSGGVTFAAWFQSGWDPSRVFFVTPPNDGRRIGRMVRSIVKSLIRLYLLGASQSEIVATMRKSKPAGFRRPYGAT